MVDVREFFDRSFGTIGAVLAEQGVSPVGAAFALYRSQPSDTLDIEVGFPTDRPVAFDRGVGPSEIPGVRAARTIHRGGFDGLAEAWGRLAQWIIGEGEVPSRPYWEVYLTEPSPDMDPADLRTELNWAVDG